MDEDYLSFCRSWFKEYVKEHNSSDPEVQKNIELKSEHTSRVCRNMERLARSLMLRHEDLLLAEAISLFHDIGRFEQLNNHKTFDDTLSADHAATGLKVLNESGILRALTERERTILRRAIWLHNKREIPEIESRRDDGILFVKLIRDADKLDVLRVVTNHFERRLSKPNRTLDFGLPDETEFSREPVNDILNCKMVKISCLKSLNDMKLMYLSWVFDINFPITVSCILEKGYLDKLILSLPQEEDICTVRDHIKRFLEDKRMILIG